jgi:uracil-DNA glycosylase
MDSDTTSRDTALPERASILSMAEVLRKSLRFHAAMGIESYPLQPEIEGVSRSDTGTSAAPERVCTVPPSVVPARFPEECSQPQAKQEAEEQLGVLHQEIAHCQMCSLASARQGVVLGQGAAGSSLMVIGDYCVQENGFSSGTMFGSDEDIMLWNMMRAIGLMPGDVYVTNAVKCCPLSSEQPGSESTCCFREHLGREVRLIRPRIICAMGELAVQAVLGGEESVYRLRGRLHRYGNITGGGDPPLVMVTYHPRFLLKHAELKKPTWQDLQMIQHHLLAGRPRESPAQT